MEKIVVPPQPKKGASSIPPGANSGKKLREEAVVEESAVTEELEEPNDSQESGNGEEQQGDPKITRTEEVDLDTKGPERQTKTKVNFVNEDFMAGFVKQKTRESTEKKDEKGATDGKTVAEIQEQIKKEEANPNNQFSKEELMDFAEVFIDIVDLGISSGLRFWAGDTSSTAYELPIEKKRKLTRQVTNLFIKYQTKFSLEFMFIITLVICYSVPAKKAHDMRKAKKKGVVIERGKGKPTK